MSFTVSGFAALAMLGTPREIITRARNVAWMVRFEILMPADYRPALEGEGACLFKDSTHKFLP